MYRSRKHPPVSGGKRPLCTLGVPPGRSRGIGECARAPCVSLAAAEGTARGYGRVRGENLFSDLYAARSRVLLDEPLVVGESRQPHWWQIPTGGRSSDCAGGDR